MKVVKYLGANVKAIGSVFSHWSKKRKISFVVATIFFGLVIFGYVKLMKSGVLYRESYQYVGSFEEMADYSITLDQTAQFEPFYNSPRVKAYSFQMKPVVVNLKRNPDSNQVPMGFFEFVFEGNSGDVVVEMKLRESEFVDVMSRVIEGYSYETLDSVDGKERLKEELRKELNKQLTEGVIRRVEIGNFFIKP
jgi:flagellar basal body-associated protein FliL